MQVTKDFPYQPLLSFIVFVGALVPSSSAQVGVSQERISWSDAYRPLMDRVFSSLNFIHRQDRVVLQIRFLPHLRKERAFTLRVGLKGESRVDYVVVHSDIGKLLDETAPHFTLPTSAVERTVYSRPLSLSAVRKWIGEFSQEAATVPGWIARDSIERDAYLTVAGTSYSASLDDGQNLVTVRLAEAELFSAAAEKNQGLVGWMNRLLREIERLLGVENAGKP